MAADLRAPGFVLLMLATPALGQGPPPGWQPVAAKLVEVDAEGPLASLSPPVRLPAPGGDLLFEAGRDWRYEVTDGDKLALFVGGRKPVTPKEGDEVKLNAVPNGERAPVKLVFRRLAGAIDGAPAVRPAQVVVAKVGARAFTFVDVNANGFFDDWEVDGWLAGDPRELEKEAPGAVRDRLRTFTGVLPVGDARFLATLRPATQLLLWPVEDTISDAVVHHMGLLNHWRRQGGMAPVGLDPAAVDGCVKHAEYCEKLGDLVHEEDKGRPGYTPQGDRAGRNSVLIGASDLLDGLRRMLRSVYERNYYMKPNLRKLGVGWAGGYYVCDLRSFSSDGSNDPPVVYPFDRQTGVHPGSVPGKPSPKPAGAEKIEGTFIVAQFNEGQKVELLAAAVRDVTRGADVKTSQARPDLPPPEAASRFPDNDACVVLFPAERLELDTVYEVTMRYRVNPNAPVAERTWRFRTAAKLDSN